MPRENGPRSRGDAGLCYRLSKVSSQLKEGSVNKLLVALSVLALWPLSLRGDGVANFDFATGEGFVPKSVVQEAFGLNNGQIRKMSESVSRVRREGHDRSELCEWREVGSFY